MTVPRMYDEFAHWWPVLSAPEDYAEEAGLYRSALLESGTAPLRTVLELGSGGGNNASHLRAWFEMTLVDLAPRMLEVSRALNPECHHVVGDMRSVRLGRHFDAVFVHDAITYMTTEEELRSVFQTAFIHLRPGGVALFAPDFVAETFEEGTDHGGHDGEGRAFRFLEWVWDPDPSDTTYVTDYVYVLREGDGPVRVESERHLEGVFPRESWLRLLREVGFRPRHRTVRHSEVDRELDLFLGIRPEEQGEPTLDVPPLGD